MTKMRGHPAAVQKKNHNGEADLCHAVKCLPIIQPKFSIIANGGDKTITYGRYILNEIGMIKTNKRIVI